MAPDLPTEKPSTHHVVPAIFGNVLPERLAYLEWRQTEASDKELLEGSSPRE